METTPATPQESLDIINQMIRNTRQEFRDNGFLYLLWGWLTFIAALLNYILMKLDIEYNYIGWLTLMPAGGIISAIYAFTAGRRQRRRARTWVDTVMAYTWSAFGVALLITLTLSPNGNIAATYPYVIMLYGMGTFISGGVMKFRWLIAGGILCWVLAVIAFFVSFEWQLLLLAASLLGAYIVPGHILQYQYKRNV